MRFFYFTYLLLLFSIAAAQKDSTAVELPEFLFQEKLIQKYNAANPSIVIDTLHKEIYSSKNVSDLLSEQSGYFIKSYGLGSLATASFRGTAAVHTSAIWNGANITNPMTGLVDLSLLPVNLFDKVSLYTGNSTALFGSGSVGASLHLDNVASFNKGWYGNFGGDLGSFGAAGTFGKLGYAGKKYYVQAGWSMQEADNDFTYTNTTRFGKPREKLIHANYLNQSFVAEGGFRINPENMVIARMWKQYANREVPPTLLQKENQSFQEDDNLRGGIEHRFEKSRYQLRSFLTYLQEQIHYVDAPALLDETSLAKSFIAESRLNYTVNKIFSFHVGANATFINSTSQGYGPEAVRQRRQAGFGSLNINLFKQKLRTIISLRKEWVEEKSLPFIYNIDLSYGKENKFQLHAKFGRVYRYPSFNDLYWIPGGNPNLKPEDGYSAEIGYRLPIPIRKKAGLILEQLFFSNHITDWILWLQGAGGIWTPENLQQVHARGTEGSIKLRYPIKRAALELKTSASYTLSTIENERFIGDAAAGKQLIYVPPLKTVSGISFLHPAYFVSAEYTYTDVRYYTADNESYLDPYGLLNLRAGYHYHHRGKKKISALFSLMNILDQEYQVIVNRPMPGRNFTFSLTYFIQ